MARNCVFGLEAGSKPELLAVLALTNGQDKTLIICNGFKDDEFLRMTVLARKIGKPIIPVIEKFTELETLVQHARDLQVRPVLGVRAKVGGTGFRSLETFGWIPLEIWPDRYGNPRCSRVSEIRGHGRLFATVAFSSRQSDH
jgi:arginine decarboxylase-like protein